MYTLFLIFKLDRFKSTIGRKGPTSSSDPVTIESSESRILIKEVSGLADKMSALTC